jgi:cytochrome c peroxidase
MNNNQILSFCRYAVVFFFAFLIASCKQSSLATNPSSTMPPDNPTTANTSIPKNPGIMVIPPDNPSNPAKIELGRHLFFDKSLSVDGSTSCASCHTPSFGFSDSRGLATSMGFGGRMGTRNAPALANIGYNTVITWDGKFNTLEQHALAPIFNNIEMANNITGVNPISSGYYHTDPGNNDTNFLFKRLKDRPESIDHKKYSDLFIAAWGSSNISMDRIVKSIACFERTFISTQSPFDRYNNGDQSVFKNNPEAVHGFKLFMDVNGANCISCHSGYNFTDQQFHNNGLIPGQRNDSGRSVISGNSADMYKFKTPSLRNIALSGPYMHDGRFRTLDEVLAFYKLGGNVNAANRDPRIRPLKLSDQDIYDIIEFLKTLTDDKFSSNPAFADPWGK